MQRGKNAITGICTPARLPVVYNVMLMRAEQAAAYDSSSHVVGELFLPDKRCCLPLLGSTGVIDVREY